MRGAAYGPAIIAYRNGNPVRLDEVAHVYDGVENDRTASWQNGERCVYLSIQKQPGINVVQIVDAIKALLPAIRDAAAGVGDARRPQRPLGHDPRVGARRQADAGDRPIALVVLVIFIFLRNISATLIPSLALPGSIARHVRGHVPARLQPRQPVADGADALGRLRRRRCHRDAGEHRPAHGDGEAADAGGATTARRRSPSRSCR